MFDDVISTNETFYRFFFEVTELVAHIGVKVTGDRLMRDNERW